MFGYLELCKALWTPEVFSVLTPKAADLHCGWLHKETQFVVAYLQGMVLVTLTQSTGWFCAKVPS